MLALLQMPELEFATARCRIPPRAPMGNLLEGPLQILAKLGSKSPRDEGCSLAVEAFKRAETVEPEAGHDAHP